MKNSVMKLVGVGCLGTLGLVSCGVTDDDADPVELRFAWWGSDQRIAATEEIIMAFEEEHSNISISPEYSDFQGYWDQLATQAAGGGAPDIMQMDLEYFREYAELGTLMDLNEVETTNIDEGLLEQGHTEGGQYGIPTGFASVGIIANEDVFEQAGLELPDDTTWTWDEFAEITSQIQGESDDAYGALTPFEPFAGLQTWLRQEGKELTTDSGELGIEAADIVGYFEHLETLDEGGSLPSASVIEEDRAAGNDRSLVTNSGVGLIFGWSNLYPTLVELTDDNLALLRFPSQTGQAEDNGMWHRASMFLSANADSDHPEEAQKFIDFFINSEESGLANGTDRGLPANTEVRNVVVNELDRADTVAAEFLNDIEAEVAEPAPVPPLGFAAVGEAMHRYQSELLFDRMTPQEAGEAAFDEIESSLQ